MAEAFYSLSVQVISRNNGTGARRSVVAAAAYRSGQSLTDEREDIVFDYSNREQIIAVGIAAPDNAPEWVRDRATLWNTVEREEDKSTRRSQAQLAREIRVCFPHQFNEQQRAEVLQGFIDKQCVGRGMIADWAIHAPKSPSDERNHHAHILLTMREVGPEGFNKKQREWNRPELVQQWREAWTQEVNRAFRQYDLRDAQDEVWQVDDRSYERRGFDKEATQHLGVHATGLERRGIQTEIGDRNRAVAESNANRDRLQEKAQQTLKEVRKIALWVPLTREQRQEIYGEAQPDSERDIKRHHVTVPRL